jgi:two-component system sensor histidine kinase KdpD
MDTATDPQRHIPPPRSQAPRWPLSINTSPLLRYGGAIGIVLASAVLADLLFHLTDDARQSMVFLPGVLVAAVLLGAGPGYLAAGAAFLIYNFALVEPRFTFSLGSAEDIVTLLGFAAAVMLTGALTTRIRRDAAQSSARADATDVLFAATQEFSAVCDEAHIRARLAHHLAAAAGGQAFVRHGLRMYVEPADAAIHREVIVEVSALARQGARLLENPASTDGWTLRVLQADDRAFGIAAWRTGAREPLRPEQQTLLEILADAGAAAIARARLSAAKTEAETRAGALVAELRQKLEDERAQPKPLLDERAVAYRLRAD